MDLSKSTTLYDNKFEVGSEAILDKMGGLNVNSPSNLFQSLSFAVSHHLDIKDIGASDNLHFSYAGLGYQNPGNNGYSGAQMKLGGNIKKYFYKNKLSLNLRTDFNNMPISYTSNDQWRNYQVQLDGRYLINKTFNINFEYTTNGTNKRVDDIITPVYSFQKIQFDGNATYKIGKDYTVTHLTIGKQDFSNSYVSAGVGSLLMINYTQSLLMNLNSLTVTVFYNKELADVKLIGNMLNSDVSYQYTLLGKVSLSSGLIYLNNSGIANQVGIRQSVQLYATTHFSVDTYLNLNKNLITPRYADLYSTCRAELSLKYNLSR